MMSPYTTLAVTPNTSTGPATVKSFAPRPVMKPSLLNSIAGDTMELAKPVMCTSIPAPACLERSSYQPRAVSVAEINIRLMDTAMRA